MTKLNPFKKILAAIAFVLFLGTGYLATNVATSCKAEAQCVCSLCTYAAGGMSTAITLVNTSTTLPGITLATTLITVHFELAMVAFTSAVGAKIFEVGRNITDWFDTFWLYNLRPAMQAMTVQLHTAEGEQSRLIGAYSDAIDANRTNLTIMGTEIDTHRAMRPGENACVAGTVTGGMTKASTFTRAYAAAAPAEALPRTGNRAGTPAAQGRGADQKARWGNYVNRYCDTTANAGNAGCAANGTYVNRDLDVNGEIFSKDTIDVRDPETKRIIDDLITNIAEPFVRDPIPPSALGGPLGQEAFLKGEAYKARRQVIHDALYHIVSRRIPGSGMGDFVNPIREAAGMDPSTFSDSPSHNEILEVMMVERFRAGTLGVDQVDEPENNARELVIQQAFQAMQMSDQLDLLDRYALILAARTGANVEKNKPFDDRMTDRPTR